MICLTLSTLDRYNFHQWAQSLTMNSTNLIDFFIFLFVWSLSYLACCWVLFVLVFVIKWINKPQNHSHFSMAMWAKIIYILIGSFKIYSSNANWNVSFLAERIEVKLVEMFPSLWTFLIGIHSKQSFKMKEICSTIVKVHRVIVVNQVIWKHSLFPVFFFAFCFNKYIYIGIHIKY